VQSSASPGPSVDLVAAEEVAALLLDGVCVQLVGRRGSGRSRVARRAADLLGDVGVPAVHLAGVRSLRDRPLAAAAVSGLGLVTPGSAPAASVVADALVRQLGSRRSALVVDDADDLDAVTAGVVHAVRRRADVPVLAVCRPRGRHRPSGLLAADAVPGVRVEVEPMRFAQVHALVHELLDGPVDPVVVARLTTRTCGLPGVLRAVVAEARRAGALRLDDDLWTAAGDLWSPRLAPALEPLLDGLRDDERDAVTVLAVAEATPVSRALELAPREVLAQLEDVGLVRVRAGRAEEVLSVCPPILGEHVRRTSTRLERQRVDTLLARHGVPRHHPAPPPSSTAGHADTLAARYAADHWRLEAAARTREWQHAPGPGTAVPLLSALHDASAGRAEVEDVLAHTPRDGSDPRALALLAAWESVFRALRFGQVDRARAGLVAARSADGGMEPFLRAVQTHLDLVRGVVGPRSGPDGASLGGDPLNAHATTAVQIEQDLAAGRVRSARGRLEDFRPALPPLHHHGEVCRGLALVLAGEVEEGVAWARHQLATLQDGLAAGPMQSHWYVAALGLTLLGRFDELDECVSAALASTHVLAIQRHYQAGLLSLAAIVAGWQGRRGYARTLAIQGRALGQDRGPFPAMIPGALLTIARGRDQADEAEVLWRAASDAFARGCVPAGVLTTVASVEHRPEPARARTAADAASGTDSPLVHAWSRYAVAAADRDESALVEASAALDAAGTPLYSVRALVTRALVLRERDDPAGACAQADAAWTVAGERGVDRRGMFTRLARAVNLTARETEVAQLVSSQMPNAEIAQALGLSTRTVETHLMNAHRKVGVDNRDDLARAVRTWLELGG
jgi:DNA-binding CsgD family transcriptional regulator